MVNVSSWGLLSNYEHSVVVLDNRNLIATRIKEQKPGIAFGMGRSYGDVCLNPMGLIWNTTRLDHLIAFDRVSGRLVCEAGVLLRDLQQLIIPRGWILPVTPGTQLITVGGAIANDVHGKNHHVLGSFGDHIRSLTLARTNGEIIHCGPNNRSDWFESTVGGLGLTGIIMQVEIQLRRVAGPWLDAETIAYTSLDEFFVIADTSEVRWEHTVSWVDCLSKDSVRGLFMRANPSSIHHKKTPKLRKLTIPLMPPLSLVNRFSLRSFNESYYYLNKWCPAKKIEYYETFFYPLDNLLNWNRMYGPKGFFQYQSVVPRDVGRDAIEAMLKEIKRHESGSFLAVLKTFGNRQAVGMLSFPMPGVTFALDFPNNDHRLHKLFERLDAIVREARGRIYPAKDARMPRALFEQGYQRLSEFVNYRDPGISSALSRRLMGS